MRVSLAFRQRKVLLRSIFGSSCRCRTRRGLVREEAFEDTLSLPFSGMSKVDPYVHTAGTAESGIKTFNMISSSKQKPFGISLVKK